MEIAIALALLVVILVIPIIQEYRQETQTQQVLVRVDDAEHFRLGKR
jgi:hypothetical protein